MPAAFTSGAQARYVALVGTLVAVVAVWSAAVSGQTDQPPAAFETADVYLRPYSTTSVLNMTGGLLRGERYDLRKATMLDLIRTAYGVRADAVAGGPNWLERDRFDIIAKAPASTPPATVRLMLQTLLADRFKLVVRSDNRQMPGYALGVAAGQPKMKTASGDGPEGCNPPPQKPEPGTVRPNVVCRNVTMAAFAERLRSLGGAYVNGPIADMTGLDGAWDFELRWTPRVLLGSAGADGISLYNAVEQQLGLTLTQQQVPATVLAVVSVNRTPTGNPSGVAPTLPAPAPAEFDVADIKLTAAEAPTTGRLQPGGRIDLQGFTMKQLVSLAWDLRGSDETIANAPDWFDDTRYSVVARSSTAVAGTAGALQIDIDDLRLMLRALLIDRFQLKTHFEDRRVDAYALVADRPRMQKANPANRTNCREGVAPGAKDPRDANPMLLRLVTCQNMSMAELAEDLARIAGGYLHHPVVDATGLEGAWDFTMNFTPAGRMGGAGANSGGAASEVALGASDPTGGLSLFDALSRQLGVKLELRKRPLPVLVIDHINEQPSAN